MNEISEAGAAKLKQAVINDDVEALAEVLQDEPRVVDLCSRLRDEQGEPLDSETPALRAAQNGAAGILRALHGINAIKTGHQGLSGNTLLVAACRNNRREAMNAILDMDADPDLPNLQETLPITAAMDAGADPVVLQILADHGARCSGELIQVLRETAEKADIAGVENGFTLEDVDRLQAVFRDQPKSSLLRAAAEKQDHPRHRAETDGDAGLLPDERQASSSPAPI